MISNERFHGENEQKNGKPIKDATRFQKKSKIKSDIDVLTVFENLIVLFQFYVGWQNTTKILH